MSSQLRALLCLALATSIVSACKDDEGELEESYGVDTPASRSEPLATCPADAPVLGSAGMTVADSFPLSWDSNGSESYVDGWMYFQIPADILSLLIAVEHEAEWTALNGMTIDGVWYVDLIEATGEWPFYHWPVEVASVTMPNSTDTIPEAGCLALDPVAYTDLSGQTGALHIVTRRSPAGPSTIDVNVFVVGDTQIADTDVMAAVEHMGEVFANGSAATLGTINFLTIDWPSAYIDAEGSEPSQLRAATGGEPTAINLLLIQDFTEVGTLGFAAGIPGPNGITGTAASGVLISVDTHLDADGTTVLTDLMGETMAHEVGHQIGLFHTSEDTGLEFDPIYDTPECPLEDYDADDDEELSAEECEAADGRNFMFWASSDEFGQFEVSPTQAMILRDSVIARPQ